MSFEVIPTVFSTVAPTPCGFLTYYPLVRDLWYDTEVENPFGREPVVVHSRFDGYYTPEGKVYLWDRMGGNEKHLSDAELAAEYFNAEAARRTMEAHMEGKKDLPEYERRGEIEFKFYDFAEAEHYWEAEEREWAERDRQIRENYKKYKEDKGYG